MRGCRFQVWGQMWPLMPFGGCHGLRGQRKDIRRENAHVFLCISKPRYLKIYNVDSYPAESTLYKISWFSLPIACKSKGPLPYRLMRSIFCGPLWLRKCVKIVAMAQAAVNCCVCVFSPPPSELRNSLTQPEGNGPLDLRQLGLWEIGMWCSMTSLPWNLSVCSL